MSKMLQTDVLIVGAGPTGLTVANVLARSKINFTIIERDTGPISESRALIVHTRTLEMFDKLNIAQAALAEAQTIHGIQLMRRGKMLGGTILLDSFKDQTAYPFPIALEQKKTQRLLLQALAEYGYAPQWATEYTKLKHDTDGIVVTVRDKNGQEEDIFTRYLVAATGARSDIRNALGLSLDGETYEESLFLADVNMEWNNLGNDRIYLDITKDYFCGFFPTREHNHFRIIGTVMPEFENKTQLSLEDVEHFVAACGVNAALSNPRWITVYRIHKRMAKSFQTDNVFLAGDAAHIHSPAGGQGMNLGIGDAFNLGWKLAAVLTGQASSHLLNSYQSERIPFAKNILKSSDQSFKVIVSDNPLLKRAKMTLAPAIVKVLADTSVGRPLAAEYFSHLSLNYFESPVVRTEQPGKVLAGDFAPYGLVADGVFTNDALRGVTHRLMLFEGKVASARFEVDAEVVAQIARQYDITDPPIIIYSNNKSLHESYAVTIPTVFLIRPDGYIGYRGTLNHIREFDEYLNTFYLSSKPQTSIVQPQTAQRPT